MSERADGMRYELAGQHPGFLHVAGHGDAERMQDRRCHFQHRDLASHSGLARPIMRVVDRQHALRHVIGGGVGTLLDLDRLQAQRARVVCTAVDPHRVRHVVQVRLAPVHGEESVARLPEDQRRPADSYRPQGLFDRADVLGRDPDIALRVHCRTAAPAGLGHAGDLPQEQPRVLQVQLGLQCLGHGRTLSHAGRDPQFVVRILVGEVGKAADHPVGPAHGPRHLLPVPVHPVVAQTDLLVVVRVTGGPVPVHRRRDVVGEERAERRPGVGESLDEDVECDDCLHRPAPRGQPGSAALRGQLTGQRGVGAGPHPDLVAGTQES